MREINFTWQTGLEALAYVPQYLLYKVDVRWYWEKKKREWKYKQGKSEGFDSCDRPSNLTQIGFKSSIFQSVWPWNLMNNLEKL